MKIQALCKIQYLGSNGVRSIVLNGDEFTVDVDVAKQLIANGSAEPVKPAGKPVKPVKPAKSADK